MFEQKYDENLFKLFQIQVQKMLRLTVDIIIMQCVRRL
jgi:hypothetical protein